MPFSARTRCVAPFPLHRASARGSGALPQPLDGCFPCRYGMIRRLRGCAHRSAVPAPHPAACPRQHGASPRLGSVGVPYSWGVPPVFLYHTLCPEATPQIHTALAQNVTPAHPWSTSRTPPPVPSQPRHAHHVFGDFLCTRRFFADLLGVLAHFFSRQQEE